MINSQRVLNDIIKTSQMGINGINVVMDKTRQPALRQALKVQRREYSDIEQQAKLLAQRKGYKIDQIKPGRAKSVIVTMPRIISEILEANSKKSMRALKSALVNGFDGLKLTEEQKKYMTWDSLRGHGYGNFMRVAENEGMTMSLTPKGEYGWDGWLGTYFCVSPEDKAVLMFFVQRIDAGTTDYTRKFRSMAYAAMED